MTPSIGGRSVRRPAFKNVVSVTTGAMDAGCAAKNGVPAQLTYDNAVSYSGELGQSNFGMHDHVYSSSGVPDASRAFALFAFGSSATVSKVTIVEHVNGVDQIEGFVGDSPDSMQSIGTVVGSHGMGHSSSELVRNVFEFPKSRAGKYFKVVFRHTPLPNGYAIYRVLLG
jgi:hypothetical protein